MKLLDEGSKEMDDDAPLMVPANFTLVRMDFQPSDVATNATFISACERGQATKVEHLLCSLLETCRTIAWASIWLSRMTIWLLCDCCWRLVLTRMQQ